MAKAVKKKTPQEASDLFHSILKASVSGNPKLKNKIDIPISEDIIPITVTKTKKK